LTVPTATGTGTATATVGNVSAGSAFAASNAITVTYTITVRRPGTSSSETFTRITSYSKSRQGSVGEPGVQGPEGPEGGNPEDIGFFSSIYIKDEIRYPWGWGRTSSVSSTLQTVLNSSTAAPVEEKLVYDPDLAGAVQSSALSTKGGYTFVPQTGQAFATSTFAYSRPIPIDTALIPRAKFSIARESGTGFGEVTVGVYFLNASLQKLTASDGNVIHTFGRFTSNTLITTALRPVTFYFAYDTRSSSGYVAGTATTGTTFSHAAS
jgi:hypothetical protein